MPSYHLFGADESYTIIEFDDDDEPKGQYTSFNEAQQAAIQLITAQLASHPSVFVPDLRYVRTQKLLHHLKECATFKDYQWGIRYKDFINPDVGFPPD